MAADHSGEMYRLRMPTTAIQAKDGKAYAVVIPSGVILTVPTGLTAHSSGTVECMWDGGVVLLLAFDLHERGTRVE